MRKAGLVILSALAVLVATAIPAPAEQGGNTGQQFHLLGGAHDAADPENPTNEAILFTTTPTVDSAVMRDVNPRTKIDMLDNQVQVKYLFVGRTCSGGSPRIQLGFDTDGDGKLDGNALGFLGDKPFGGGCPEGEWIFEDMTNDQAKWDLSELGGPMAATWDEMEVFMQTVHPDHQVANGALVDNSCEFVSTACGTVYFDNVVIGNRSISGHSDTAGK